MHQQDRSQGAERERQTKPSLFGFAPRGEQEKDEYECEQAGAVRDHGRSVGRHQCLVSSTGVSEISVRRHDWVKSRWERSPPGISAIRYLKPTNAWWLTLGGPESMDSGFLTSPDWGTLFSRQKLQHRVGVDLGLFHVRDMGGLEHGKLRVRCVLGDEFAGFERRAGVVA